ncbi:hypothetical protein [Haloplanus halobius]|uniref:hypothetical protein n=1 Tax=Haloplanus halobius TaxID=2934938 RepID=UPI00200EBD57|nr:hypothetical protein [Haloplanus sp. XH21]
MTHRRGSDPRWTQLLAVGTVCLLIASVFALPVVAVNEPRSEPTNTSPPVTVYVGEQLDVSDVQLTGATDGEINDGPLTLQQVDGNASVDVDDPTNADFAGVDPGRYYVTRDNDQRPEIHVVEPHVTSLLLRSGDGRNVTDQTVRSLSSLIVRAEYDFDNVDRLDVTIRGPDGEPLGLNPQSARITESGERMSVYMADRAPGTYTVTVRGSIVAGQRSATVTIRGDRTATPSPTPTATPSATPTATASPTPTATASPTPTATASATPTANATTTSPATPTEMPATGFGFGLAAVAVFGLALAALRRR